MCCYEVSANGFVFFLVLAYFVAALNRAERFNRLQYN